MTAKDAWTAPAGTVWVCGACGKHGPQRDRIGDESCFLNAVLCWKGVTPLSNWNTVPTNKLKEFGLDRRGWKV